MLADSRRGRVTWGLLALAPALGLLVLVAWVRVDAPLPDDVDAILAFANRSVAAESVTERVALMLEPHVDHRIAVTRALAALQLALRGSLDLRGLALPGVLAWLCLGALLPGLRAEPRRAALVAAAPVAWLLFQPQPYDALVSPTMGANLQVAAFAAAALASLRRPGAGGFAGAVVLAALALGSQGNGVLVLPAGLLALWWAGRRRAAGAWLAVSALLALGYASGNLSSRAAPLPLASGDPLGGLGYGLAFLGSALVMGSREGSLAAGAGMLAFRVVRALCGDARRSPWLWGLLVFALLSIAANALGRAGLGADYAVAQPRYRAYSALVLALCHLVAFERWGGGRSRRYAVACLAIAVTFGCVSSARHAPEAQALASRAARSLARFAVTGTWRAHPRPEHAAEVLARSAELGVFRADPEALAPFLDRAVSRRLPAASQLASGALTRDASGGGFRLIEGRVDPAGLDAARLRLFVVLDDGERVVEARVLGARRAGRSLRFRALAPTAPSGARERSVGLLLDDGANEAYVRSLAAQGST